MRPGQAEHSANVIADVVRDALASCEMTHVTPRALVRRRRRRRPRDGAPGSCGRRSSAAISPSELVIHSDFSIALDDAFGDGPGVL